MKLEKYMWFTNAVNRYVTFSRYLFVHLETKNWLKQKLLYKNKFNLTLFKYLILLIKNIIESYIPQLNSLMIIFKFQGRFMKLDELDGVNSKSRFGLSLTSLGDINLDGYTGQCEQKKN